MSVSSGSRSRDSDTRAMMRSSTSTVRRSTSLSPVRNWVLWSDSGLGLGALGGRPAGRLGAAARSCSALRLRQNMRQSLALAQGPTARKCLLRGPPAKDNRRLGSGLPERTAMHIDVEHSENHATLHLRGEFDTYYVRNLQEEIDALVEGGVARIVLNLRLVKFINSTALGAIIKASKA